MAQPIGQLERVRALATSARTCWVGGVRADKASQITAYDHVAEKPSYTIDVESHVLALVCDGDALIAACSDGIVRIYEPKDGKPVREIKAHAGACNAIAVRKGVLATGGADGTLRLFDLESGKKKKEWQLSSRPLRSVAIDPTGESFAGAGDDGMVRVIGHGEERRDMPGHDGPVLCIAFTPADGRLVSGGEDGTVRVWYLIGAIESDIRGKDDAGHLGGVLALAFLPAKDPAEIGERLASCGADGKVRLWRMSERRKPRTLEAGSEGVFALAFAPSTKQGTTGALLTGGDSRTIYGYSTDATGAVGDKSFRWMHGFDVLAESLAAPARPKREAAVKTLAPLGELEALELLLKSLANDKEPEVRAQIAGVLAENQRRDARKALRARLDDEHGSVRMAALAALRVLEADAPLSPLRSALDSRFADTRIQGLTALPALFATAPLVSGLIASHLADEDAGVRHSALTQLVSLHAPASVEPLRIAFERGKADVRAEVLVRGALSKLTTNADFSPIVGKALDDDDADVRRIAFVISALARPVLGAWLEKNDEPFGRALGDLLRRAAQLEGGSVSADGVDPDVAKVKDVSQFFARFIHPKHGEVSIFQPKIHTPIKAGDEVRLVRIAPVGTPPNVTMRAEDYVVGAAKESSPEQVAALRGKLVAPAAAKDPEEVDREPLLAALACRTPDTALRGARGLALLGDMRALGALLSISREPDATLRRDAVVALAALPDARARRRIVWMLNDPDAGVRDASLACYAKVEPAALMVAEAALHSSQEDVRVRGLDILVKQGKGNAEAERLLGDAIEDEAAKVRSEAFRTLWAWHDADPLGPIDRALSARFPDLRARAVTELVSFAKKKDDKLAAPSLERLSKAIADRDQAVAKAAYDGALEIKGKEDEATHLAAIASTHPTLRAIGAKDAAKATVEGVRSALMKLLEDIDANVRVAALESLDKLVKETGPLGVGLQSSYLDLRVRAAELLAERRDDLLINPMQALIADKDLLTRLAPAVIVPLRQRAATALANLGTPRLLRYFATEMVKDDDSIVREQAARGLSNASRRGEEGYLLDLLGHTEVAIRSWAAEGLARLGDARALPVLTGTLRHEHPPIRVGAILSFAALGPEGYGGMLQGLEDPSRDVQRIVLSVILARDLRAFRKQESPELLTSALSSQRPEVRFAAARALELRITPEDYLAHLVELLMPTLPEKAADMEKWPGEELRTRMMVALAEALAGERPEQRYAAAQALRLRDRPIEYFREVQRAVMPRSVKSPWIPDTSPRGPAEGAGKKKPLALLRRLFANGAEVDENAPEPAPSPISADEQRRLRLLAFGAYVGLLRQAGSDDEGHRVRRDAIERLVELCQQNHVSVASATPALARALDDPNHLVRQAAFAALRKVFPNDPEAPLGLALASSSADVVKSALDDLAARGDESKPRVAKALDSRVAQARKYAFDLLEKLSPPGSLEPLLAALGSEHPDIRIGVLERLSTSQDPRVAAALVKALESDHDDLRLRAAEMLAARKDDRAADALAPWLRAEDAKVAARARDALAGLGTATAVRALAARFEDTVPDAERVALTEALSRTKAQEASIDALAARFADETEAVRRAAFAGCVTIVGPRSDAERVRGQAPPKPRNVALAQRFLEAAVRAKAADVRQLAAAELDDLEHDSADALLVGLFADRDITVRSTAVRSYATRVEKKGSKPEPLMDVLKGGARETMLAAAEGLATRHDPSALRPLLLFARAGDGGDRERALLSLGTLGDKRALAELEVIANGGTEEAPAEVSMQAAALEGLGRLLRKLDPDDKERIRDKIESSIGTKEPTVAVAAVHALRWTGGGERARARIEAVLSERSSSTPERVAAAKSLGELGDPTSEKALAKALNDYDDDVRWGAREALDKIFANDRTRVEFLAVESDNEDISQPAAAYLATEGNAALLLEKLAKLSNDALREHLRFGLVRRDKIPSADLVKLLSAEAPSARADAAWLTGARALLVSDADRKALGPALVDAAKRAEKAHAAATKAGKDSERDGELGAWLRSTWAARKIDQAAMRADAKRWLADANVPAPIRIQSAHALAGSKADLVKALADADGDVRSAAATALAPMDDVSSTKLTVFDPVRLSLAAEKTELSTDVLSDANGRKVYLARAIREHDTEALEELAKEGDARIEAIAALGFAATPSAIETLESLCGEDSEEEEELKKAAYRSLRRAQRIVARKEARS